MALSGELNMPTFVNSGRAQEYASQMRNNPNVNGRYAASKKEPLITKKELKRLALVVIAVVVGTLVVGAAMKSSQKAGYVSDSHGNVSYAGMRVYEEPGSGISRGGSGD